MNASKRPAILSFSIIVLQLFISSNSLGEPNQSVSLSPYESVPTRRAAAAPKIGTGKNASGRKFSYTSLLRLLFMGY